MASSLRQRLPTEDTASDSKEKTTDQADEVQPAPTSKTKSSQHKVKGVKRRNGFIFFLGGLVGIISAGLFARSNNLIEFPEFATMDTLLDVLPASVIQDARELMRGEREATNYDSFSVGLNLVAQGVRAKHSVIMVPGVISTGLESWGTENKSRPYFRKRLWGSWSMMRALVLDKEEWKRHIMLDKITGLDPPGVKLRAAQGFDATDFFITGYWIWNKILENLATIGYDPTNSFTAAYDWRLSYENLEVRDQYFTRLKTSIELDFKVSNRKVVLVSHSMGSQVMFYFFHWVASADGGNGGDNWVDNYIESWINISGCMLGALKELPTVLSGEMKDTAQLNTFAVYGLERFLSRHERAEIFRAMPGMSSMLPMGGNAVWGNMTWAPDDQPGQNVSFGSFLNFRDNSNTNLPQNLTVEGSFNLLFNSTEQWYVDQVKRSVSQGVAHTHEEVEANEKDQSKWVNPLETRLPLAPNLKIYCFYAKLNVTIDTSITTGNIDHGIVMGEGDGTVNLLSLGYMCNKGWHIKRYNPAAVKIKVFEMPHEPDRFNPRGGPKTADHVDILGRQSLNDLILRVAAGRGDAIQETIVSNIKEYADKVKIYDN